MRVLVASDFSSCSAAAIHQAAELAHTLDADVLLVHAYHYPATVLPDGTTLPVEPSTAEDMLQHLDGQLALEAGVLRAQGIPTTTLLVEGNAASAIVEAATDHDVSVIVVGTHGRTGLRRWLLGSVAEHVVRMAHCPVMTVREREAAVVHH
jgi:nucleotide-binding universal stress UspA family protein